MQFKSRRENLNTQQSVNASQIICINSKLQFNSVLSIIRPSCTFRCNTSIKLTNNLRKLLLNLQWKWFTTSFSCVTTNGFEHVVSSNTSGRCLTEAVGRMTCFWCCVFLLTLRSWHHLDSHILVCSFSPFMQFITDCAEDVSSTINII